MSRGRRSGGRSRPARGPGGGDPPARARPRRRARRAPSPAAAPGRRPRHVPLHRRASARDVSSSSLRPQPTEARRDRRSRLRGRRGRPARRASPTTRSRSDSATCRSGTSRLWKKSPRSRPTIARASAASLASAPVSSRGAQAVAQDDDAVGQLADLAQAVRHEHDRGALVVAERAEQTEHARDIVAAEAAGDLVEQEQPRPRGERLGDLHELAVPRSQRREGRRRVAPARRRARAAACAAAASRRLRDRLPRRPHLVEEAGSPRCSCCGTAVGSWLTSTIPRSRASRGRPKEHGVAVERQRPARLA